MGSIRKKHCVDLNYKSHHIRQTKEKMMHQLNLFLSFEWSEKEKSLFRAVKPSQTHRDCHVNKRIPRISVRRQIHSLSKRFFFGAN